jgi:hypothetical protein
MKFRRTVLSVSITAAIATLSACGGGGGGGGSPSPIIRPDTPSIPTPTSGNPVPFYTPQRVGDVVPVNTTGVVYDSTAIYSENIDSNSGGELILAGRMAPNGGTYYTSNISIFSWENGSLVNKTSQWFSGTDNRIIGTEPSVRFGDFDGDGKKDMYVAPHTDSSVRGPGSVFFNNGSNFTRLDIDVENISGHDSAVYDLNRDGLSDIVTLSFGHNVKFTFGAQDRNLVTYTNQNTSMGGGSGLAIGDFMNNGASSLLVTDSAGANRIFSWSLTGGNLSMTQEVVLPTQRFLLPTWAGYNFTGSHDIRALAFDFDNSGKTSAVIFSRPWMDANGNWPVYSEVQFLKNHGNGIFTDVTDTTLIGYDHTQPVSYNPYLFDVNNDGLVDIVLPGSSWTSNQGAQVLVHTAEHKYVTSWATVLRAFQDQAYELERAINQYVYYGANGVVFVQGPDGKMYLATAISYSDTNSQRRKAIYLSQLGASTVSAQATADAIRQTWPWMSDAQVNTVLAASSTTWLGMNLLDSSKALTPVGTLQIPGINRMLALNGSVGGIRLNGAANQIKVLDSVGRDFNINYSGTNYQLANQFSRMVEHIDDDTRGAQLSGMNFVRYNGFKFAGSDDNRYAALGITGIKIGQNTELSVQYSRMPFSPFVQLNGSWGLVKDSSTIESTITKRNGGFVDKLGVMYSSTEIEKGMVQRINPITSVWAETGYEWTNFKMYGGILPKVVSGSADITLPTGIDNRGQISYTNTRADVYSPTVTYARFSYNDRINKKILYRINGIVTSQQQHSIVGDVQISF